MVLGLSALLSLSVLAAPASAETCDRFASPSGSDANPGTAASPYKSPQQLVDSLSAGQTGCLRAGDYTASDGYVLRFEHPGAPGAPISVRSYPGERARLVGIVTVPNGVDHVRLADVDVEGTGIQNTVKIYASDVVIEGNDITNRMRGGSCMMLGSSSAGRAVRPIIRGNFFHDCGATANDNKDHSIYAAAAHDATIEDNVFVNSAGKTIQLYPDAQRNRVAHNVIDGGPDTVRGGIVIGGNSTYASSGNVVEQNIITYAATYNVYSNWEGPVGNGNIVRDNCLWGAGQGDIHDDGGLVVGTNPHADPRFYDRAARDYRLAAGSPCLTVVGYDTAARLAGGAAAGSGEGDSTPPTVSWSAPTSGQVLRAALTALAGNCLVDAGDASGVVRVDFEVDGQPLGSDSFAPWSCAWDPGSAADGPRTLKATAYDAAGNAASATVAIDLDLSSANVVNEAPWVDLIAPAPGATFKDWLAMSANAGDDNAVVKVEFYVDGVVRATDTSAPYSVNWRAPKSVRRDAYHTVAARSYDALGLTAAESVTVRRTR